MKAIYGLLDNNHMQNVESLRLWGKVQPNF